MRVDIYQKRNELFNKSMQLKRLISKVDTDYETGTKIREQQDALYKKKIFYDNIIRRIDDEKRKNHAR